VEGGGQPVREITISLETRVFLASVVPICKKSLLKSAVCACTVRTDWRFFCFYLKFEIRKFAEICSNDSIWMKLRFERVKNERRLKFVFKFAKHSWWALADQLFVGAENVLSAIKLVKFVTLAVINKPKMKKAEWLRGWKCQILYLTTNYLIN
jgi:hypothetical protein